MRFTPILTAAVTACALAACDYLPPWLQKPPGSTGVTFSHNSYKGVIQAEFVLSAKPDDNFRDMKLLNAISYVDPRGVSWDVPAGYVTNGASVPWGLWNIVGGPYDGPYRDAAVIHDYYTEFKQRSWEDTHRMYYEASLARGVSEKRASIMYAGLLIGSDRWNVVPAVAAPAKKAQMMPDPFVLAQVPPPATSKPIASGATPTNEQQRIFDDMKAWIEREKPSPAEIEKRVEAMRKSAGMSSKPK